MKEKSNSCEVQSSTLSLYTLDLNDKFYLGNKQFSHFWVFIIFIVSRKMSVLFPWKRILRSSREIGFRKLSRHLGPVPVNETFETGKSRPEGFAATTDLACIRCDLRTQPYVARHLSLFEKSDNLKTQKLGK